MTQPVHSSTGSLVITRSPLSSSFFSSSAVSFLLSSMIEPILSELSVNKKLLFEMRAALAIKWRTVRPTGSDDDVIWLTPRAHIWNISTRNALLLFNEKLKFDKTMKYNNVLLLAL